MIASSNENDGKKMQRKGGNAHLERTTTIMTTQTTALSLRSSYSGNLNQAE